MTWKITVLTSKRALLGKNDDLEEVNAKGLSRSR